MPASFSRTTTALHAERFETLVRFGMIAGLIIMLCWLLWFFNGTVYHYLKSESSTITLEPQPVWRLDDQQSHIIPYRRYTIIAHFSKADLPHIEKGQQAALYFSGDETLPNRPFITTVDQVNSKERTATLHLEVRKDDALSPGSDAQAPEVEVAVASETPAAFLFHVVTAKSDHSIP